MIFSDLRVSTQGVINRTIRAMERYSAYCSGVNCIFDIGANVGVYSICFAEYFPQASIVAFEPVPDNCRYLQKHIKDNGLKARITTEECGLWSFPLRMKLGIPEHRKDIENIGLYSVYGSKLQLAADFQIMDKWAHLKPDLIKIDAEGAELNILEGASECLSTVRYLILAKHQDHLDHPEQYQEVFARYGFESKPKLKRKEDIFLERNESSS